MPTDSTRERLDELDRAAEPAACRFDAGPRLTGRIAVLPAAFNPPTLAHVHLVELAANEPGIDGAAALLSTRNVDKGVHGATLEQRVEMLLALTASHPFAVLATNQARLADQSRALQEAFAGVAFDFVVGYDTLVRLFDERYYTDMAADLKPFFANHRVIATNRAQHGLDEVREFVRGQPLAAVYADRILIRRLDDEPASFSSTAARNHAATGEHLPQLPGPVAEYVQAHGLYRERL